MKKLIAGPDGLHLRRVHRALQRHHRRGDREGAESFGLAPVPKPAEIKTVLDEYVIGQERAKKILAVAVHNHYKRIDAKVGRRRRRARQVEHPAARPDRLRQDAARADAGEDPQRAVRHRRRHHPHRGRLRRRGRREHHRPAAAERRPRHRAGAARHRLHRRDRQDRAQERQPRRSRATSRARACSRRCSRSSRARSATCRPRAAASTRSRSSCRSTPPTSSSSAAAPSSGSRTSSSSASARSRSASAPRSSRRRSGRSGSSCSEVQPEDLLKYGMIPEFIGRLPVIATLHELNEEALDRHPHQAEERAGASSTRSCSRWTASSSGSPRARCRRSPRDALKHKSGARGLRAILEHAMLDIMYEVPSTGAADQGGRHQRGDHPEGAAAAPHVPEGRRPRGGERSAS